MLFGCQVDKHWGSSDCFGPGCRQRPEGYNRSGASQVTALTQTAEMDHNTLNQVEQQLVAQGPEVSIVTQGPAGAVFAESDTAGWHTFLSLRFQTDR